ncbi:MAG: hypothetical protein M3Y87_03070 [Myxococcota bacterium]|nr:hypothetical protein [Myxococcota bacterium]
MDPAAMLSGRTRETQIRRDSLGRWFDGEVPITHTLLTQAFDAWIERADDGRYCLKNDINWAYVAIEGAPVFVRSLELGGGGVTMHLSDGRDEPLDPSTLRQSADGALHCQVRGGTLPARFDSHAALQLSPLIDEDAEGTYVALEGTRARPPVVEDALAWPS